MRPLKNLGEIVVVGGGLAGLSAARHAARLGRLVTLMEGAGLYGGQLATVGHVDGLLVPGRFSGQDLALALLEEARKVGVRILETAVERVEIAPRLTVVDETGAPHRPQAVIVASGASLRRLGVPGEEALNGRGVSRCASCDGGFFRGQDVAVIGGGDAAFHEALVLAATSRKVSMICRGPVKAKRDYVDRLSALENVDFVWDSEVIAILGREGVTGVRLRNVRTGVVCERAIAGVFPFIGVEPNSGVLPEALRLPSGHVRTGPDFATSEPGLFAIGAVRAGYGGNVVQALAEGLGAAEAAARLVALDQLNA